MSPKARFVTDMILTLAAGINAWIYAANQDHAYNLGVAVTCGIAALVKWPARS